MLSSTFPLERPTPSFERPVPVELVVRRQPLAAIRELLSISIHDIVNQGRLKLVVADLYKITRKVEAEAWLRLRLEEEETRRWIEAHL